jgi:hypothetical protein
MPKGRIMGDAVILPDGKVLIVNGASVGYAGYDKGSIQNRINVASVPSTTPLLYDPKAPKGARWTKLANDPISRVYHSTATLIPDGTVFVAGSNPNGVYCDTCKYPTEYRAEIFTPPYLLNGTPKPVIKSLAGLSELNGMTAIPVTYSQLVTVIIDLVDPTTTVTANDFIVSLIHMGFMTHSQHMSSRYVKLKVENLIHTETGYAIDITMPPNPNIFIPGRHNYLFVTYKGTPAVTAVEVNLQKAAPQ